MTALGEDAKPTAKPKSLKERYANDKIKYLLIYMLYFIHQEDFS